VPAIVQTVYALRARALILIGACVGAGVLLGAM